APTIINRIIANTFKITKAFSTLAASDTPLDNRNATKRITTNDIKSTIPPLVPKGLDKEAGKLKPIGANKPLILALNQEPTNATAIKYSDNNTQPAIQQKNSPKTTLIHEKAEPAKGMTTDIYT